MEATARTTPPVPRPAANAWLPLQGATVPSPALLRLRVGGGAASLDVWYVDLDGHRDTLGRLRGCLSDEERERAAGIPTRLHRARFVAGRAVLRHVLADRLGCAPIAVQLAYEIHGKPTLHGGSGRVEFSLAYSRGDAVIALADRSAVGVDIERFRPIENAGSIANVVFSEIERGELDRSSDPTSAFLNGWTRKEAYVKALGLGLAAPLTQITVSLDDDATLLATGVAGEDPSDWRLLSLPHPRGVVAVALGPQEL